MSIYFNPARGPLPVVLADGTTAIVPPKGRIRVEASQDGSSDLLTHLRTGNLVRLRGSVQKASEERTPDAPEAVERPSLPAVIPTSVEEPESQPEIPVGEPADAIIPAALLDVEDMEDETDDEQPPVAPAKPRKGRKRGGK